MITDPIADMLTRLRNAAMAGHESVLIPASKMNMSIIHILRQEGFIQAYEMVGTKNRRAVKVTLKYEDRKEPLIRGLKRVSKPGLRVYIGRDEIPRVYGGLGVAIISTSKGVMAGYKARRQGLGGELICYIW
jgi:small subunit ribosomal protein S8